MPRYSSTSSSGSEQDPDSDVEHTGHGSGPCPTAKPGIQPTHPPSSKAAKHASTLEPQARKLGKAHAPAHRARADGRGGGRDEGVLLEHPGGQKKARVKGGGGKDGPEKVKVAGVKAGAGASRSKQLASSSSGRPVWWCVWGGVT